MKYVLDASAVMAYLRGETGADHMEALLARPTAEITMHAVNLLEVYYKLASYGGELTAKEAVDDMAALGIKIYEKVDSHLRQRSGFFKIRYPFLSLADSICVALGDQTRATVVTCDRPFANVKDEVKVEFIR